MSNANAPAYPRYYLSQNRDGEYQLNTDGDGLTKREAMAMHIMAGMLSEANVINTPFEKVANWAVASADALLAELARTAQ